MAGQIFCAIFVGALVFGMGFLVGYKRGAKLVATLKADVDAAKKKLSGVV